jgi:mono/diheme cytochrome c family protein
MKRYILLVTAIFLSGVVACDSGPRSPVGFRLPEGDIERGKAAFLELQCYGCHRVAGVALPPPTEDLAKPVALGGEIFRGVTDGYLVTSIVHPSYRLARGYSRKQIAMGEGVSRMPNHGNSMTVHQMIDLVAFLQSRYTVVPPRQPVF